MDRAPGNRRSAVTEWVAREADRRDRLSPAQLCPTVLLSFPRSGNHLVRWAVEESLGWSTLGASDGEWLPRPERPGDAPLHVRGLVSRPCRLDVALVKRHSPRDLDRFASLVFLERHPVEAILSHRRDAPDEELPAVAALDARAIGVLRRRFESFPGAALHVRYEDVATDPACMASVISWLQAHDPRLPATALPLASFASLPQLTRRPRQSRPGDHRHYRDARPDRARIVAAALLDAGVDDA